MCGSSAASIAMSAGDATRDDGGPFGFGNQVLFSSHRKLLRSKAAVVVETPGQEPAGTVERGERKRSAAEVSKGGRVASSSDCAKRPKAQEIGLTGGASCQTRALRS